MPRRPNPTQAVILLALTVLLLLLGHAVGRAGLTVGLLSDYDVVSAGRVVTWEDDRLGLVCVAAVNHGLSCVPTANTTYGKEIRLK
jgi:hypothetical protein